MKNQDEEMFLNTEDNIRGFSPDFEPSMVITKDGPRYYLTGKADPLAGDPGSEIEVSADVWRDAVLLYRASEARCARELLREALSDTSVDDTLGNLIKRMAEAMEQGTER